MMIVGEREHPNVWFEIGDVASIFLKPNGPLTRFASTN